MVMETDFPDSPAGRPFLENYFPHRLRNEFGEHFEEHVLRREIVATAAVNYLVNQAGVTFLCRMMAATKAGIGEVVTAYVDVDREAEAGRLRGDLLAKGLLARAEQDALLAIEESPRGVGQGAALGEHLTGGQEGPRRPSPGTEALGKPAPLSEPCRSAPAFATS